MTESTEAGIIIGRLIQSDARSFIFRCGKKESISQLALGAMIEVDLDPTTTIFAIVTNIRYLDDAMIAQLATADVLPENVVENHRIMGSPVIDALMVGFTQNNQIIQTIPPRPPIRLENVRLSTSDSLYLFTHHALSYFQNIYEARNTIFFSSVLSSHISMAHSAHRMHYDDEWLQNVVDRLTDMLIQEYPILKSCLEALAQLIPEIATLEWGINED